MISSYASASDEKVQKFQPYKLNYFITNGLPGNPEAQVKFQISTKFLVFKKNSYFFKNTIYHFCLAYTQKSFWDIGKPSAPFEENNYNPEVFIDYWIPENWFKLDHVILSGEHESNGRDVSESRSWNRLYVLFSFGVEKKESTEKTVILHHEKHSGYVKLWQAFGYEDQDNYLRLIKKDEKFLDYAGKGEIGFSIRNPWLRDNQLDLKTRIFRDWNKPSYEIGYNQKIPFTNFFIYIQYWDGFGESLLNFDKRSSKIKGGVSFIY